MTKYGLLFALCGAGLPGMAWGAETSSAEGVLKKFHDTNVITDAKLKADAGSFTRFSLKANLSYYGPPVSDLGAKDQPNPDQVVTSTKTAVAGTVGARVRFDPTTTMSFGSGLKQTYPFREEQKLAFTNPYLTYDKSLRLGDVQVVASPGVFYVNDEVLKAVGASWGAAARVSTAYNMGESKFAAGTDWIAVYNFFNRAYRPGAGRGKRGDGKVQRATLLVSPSLKYNFTRKLSAISSLGFTFWNPRAAESRLQFRGRRVNSRLGLGYAITSAVYVNPYLQLYPTRFTWKTVTANISTAFSVL
jgi:hypothetical protein